MAPAFPELGVVFADIPAFPGLPADPLAVLDRLPAAVDRYGRDSDLARLSGRWQVGRPDPDVFVAGDVAALRAIAAGEDLATAAALCAELAGAAPGERAALLHRAASHAAIADAVLDAVPYFIPDRHVEAVCDSDPPTVAQVAELRLPHERVAVFLGRDVPLDPDLVRAADVDQVDGGHRLAGLRRGAYLTGVVLFAAPDGSLEDLFCWLLTAAPDPAQPYPFNVDRARGVLAARRSVAGLAPLVHTLAAVACWVSWSPPPRTFTAADGTLERRSRSGGFRRWEQHGAFVESLHVIDLRPSSPRTPDGRTVGGPRRAPREHTRRGHFRRVPVGRGARSLPPHERDYETRWIPPAVVNAGVGAPRPVVYRIDDRRTTRQPPSPRSVSS